MSQTVEDAFELFSRLSSEAALTVDGSFQPEAFGNRIVTAARDRAKLRLLWDEKQRYLSLEISHGPASGEQVSYIELFGATCEDGFVPPEIESAEGVRDAVEYGIELMSGQRKNT